jgi:hypothetical protein
MATTVYLHLTKGFSVMLFYLSFTSLLVNQLMNKNSIIDLNSSYECDLLH